MESALCLHGDCAFGRGVSSHGPPLPPLLRPPANWCSFHGVTQLSPQPDASAPSRWAPAESTIPHLLMQGLISGWWPKGKAFTGVKKLVLTQWNAAATSQCWCQPEDCSLYGTAHAWCAQALVTWASSAWALHLQFQSGGLSHAGQSSVPEASLSAGSSRDVTQGDGLSKQQEQKHFSSCVPCVIAGRNLELFSQPVNMLQAAHLHHPLHTPQTTQRPPRPPLQLHCWFSAQVLYDGGSSNQQTFGCVSCWDHPGHHLTGIHFFASSSTGCMRGKHTVFVLGGEDYGCWPWVKAPFHEMPFKTDFRKGTSQKWHVRERGCYLAVWIGAM